MQMGDCIPEMFQRGGEMALLTMLDRRMQAMHRPCGMLVARIVEIIRRRSERGARFRNESICIMRKPV